MDKELCYSYDLLSDASLLSDEGVPSGRLTNTMKQVRFQDSPIESSSKHLKFPDSFPRKSVRGNDAVNADDIEIRSSPPPKPDVASSLDLSVLDEPHLSKGLGALTLDTPQANTVKALQEELIQLANRVYAASNSREPSAESVRAVLRKHEREMKSVGEGVSVNFGRQERIFTDLVPADEADEEEIVLAEKERIARYRKRLLAKAARLHPPKAEILPEPDPMKFFDPSKQIFESARLDLGGLKNPKPRLECISTTDLLENIRLDHLMSATSYLI